MAYPISKKDIRIERGLRPLPPFLSGPRSALHTLQKNLSAPGIILNPPRLAHLRKRLAAVGAPF